MEKVKIDKDKKKVVIAVGGTGGHVFPAVALANQLSKANPSCEVLFVGGNLHSNRYFSGFSFPFRTVACAPLVSVNPLKLFVNGARLAYGSAQSLGILRNYTPDLVVGFGSYYTFPTLMAARFLGIPFILHESNSIPGRVNKLFAKKAIATGIHFPETAKHLDGQCIEVGMPLREGFSRSKVNRAEALAYFGLDDNKRTILIFGGSQGAQRINSLFSEAFVEYLPHLREYSQSSDCELKPKVQLLHLTGDVESAKKLQAYYENNHVRHCVKSFENKMELAWAAADLVVSRAGAATIAEQMEFEVPGILIPFPKALDQHQDHNALFMEKIVGGAIVCFEQGLTSKSLAGEIDALFASNEAKRVKLWGAFESYKQFAHQRSLHELVLVVLNKNFC